MADHPSALKRHRQGVKRRVRNKSVKAQVSTLRKRMLSANKEDAVKIFRILQSQLDKAGRRQIFHPKTAAKKVAKLHAAILNNK